MTTETVCRAADPTKCRYHTAYRSMREALERGDLGAYAKHRNEAEKHIHEEERRNFFMRTKADTQARTQELNDSKNIFRFTRGPKPKFITYKSNSSDNRWLVSAENDETGSTCLDCHRRLTLKSITDTFDGQNVICSHCQSKTPPGVGEYYLTQQAVENLDPETTKNSVWYHATTNPNWFEDLSNDSKQPMIHAGTRLAAWMRAKAVKMETGETEPFYLYEVKINPDVEISRTLYEDEDYYDQTTPKHPKTVTDVRDGFETNKVMRYANWWEDTGSVSIMASSNQFTATKVGTMDLGTPYQG